MLTIRTATVGDALSVGAIRVESWRAAYRDFIPAQALAAMRPQEIVERWRVADQSGGTLIAELDGAAVGYAGFGEHREPRLGYASELYTLYFRPAMMGKGFGRQLFEAVTARLAGEGRPDMMLWAFEQNAPAHRFYERLGGRRIDGARKESLVLGKTLFEIGYGFRLPLAV